MILAGSWQLRRVLLAIVPTLVKPVGQSLAAEPEPPEPPPLPPPEPPPFDGGKAPSPGEATSDAPPPQAARAMALSDMIRRFLRLVVPVILLSAVAMKFAGAGQSQVSPET